MDETYIKVAGRWKYLYRAVDRAGQTVDFLPRAHRDVAAARSFFERAIDAHGIPETVTIDRSGANTAAIEGIRADSVVNIGLRQSKYLNNIVEQDHRAIKRRVLGGLTDKPRRRQISSTRRRLICGSNAVSFNCRSLSRQNPSQRLTAPRRVRANQGGGVHVALYPLRQFEARRITQAPTRAMLQNAPLIDVEPGGFHNEETP